MNSVFNVLQLEQAVTFLTCRGGRFEKSTGSPSVPKVFLDIPQIISAYLGGGYFKNMQTLCSDIIVNGSPPVPII